MSERQEQLRDATRPTERDWFVMPSGRIATAYYGSGIVNGVTDERGKLLDERRAEGWLPLREAYLDDPDLGPEGYAVWQDAQSARRRGLANTKLSDDYLPTVVLERREQTRTQTTFTPPPPPKRKRLPRKPRGGADVTD